MTAKPTMTHRQRELFDIFKTAIEGERAGQKLYQDAVATCDDDDLRAVLQGFCGEEVKHEAFLLQEYAKHRATFADAAQ